jgi:hypothetical protein
MQKHPEPDQEARCIPQDILLSYAIPIACSQLLRMNREDLLHQAL